MAGCLACVWWIMPPSMIADITDVDALQTGERREGSFFGLFFFGQQIATGVALLLVGVLVDHFAGLIPGQASQSLLTSSRIGLLFGVLPASCLFLGALVIHLYRLDEQSLLQIQRELKRTGQPRQL
jgi:GPH family glycoside/pentoside/hexuronide:cation symporter